MRRLFSRKKISFAAVFCGALLIVLKQQLSPPSSPGTIQGIQAPTKRESAQPTQPITATGAAQVIRVVDGDTLVVTVGVIEEKIRVIGINSPESVDPRKPVECFGREASAHAKELLIGQSVSLVSDPSQDNRDKYQRLLRYVYVNNGIGDFGKRMLQDGYAHEYTYDLPYQHQQEYQQTQQQAQQSKKGLWADAACPKP